MRQGLCNAAKRRESVDRCFSFASSRLRVRFSPAERCFVRSFLLSTFSHLLSMAGMPSAPSPPTPLPLRGRGEDFVVSIGRAKLLLSRSRTGSAGASPSQGVECARRFGSRTGSAGASPWDGETV